MNRRAQNVLYCVILAIVALTFYLIRPAYHYVPHGVFLPSSTTAHKAVSPSDVKVLSHLPMQFTKVGIIRAQIHFGDINKKQMIGLLSDVANYVKTLSAKNGANAVIYTAEGVSPGGPSPLDGVMIYATAIKV